MSKSNIVHVDNERTLIELYLRLKKRYFELTGISISSTRLRGSSEYRDLVFREIKKNSYQSLYPIIEKISIFLDDRPAGARAIHSPVQDIPILKKESPDAAREKPRQAFFTSKLIWVFTGLAGAQLLLLLFFVLGGFNKQNNVVDAGSELVANTSYLVLRKPIDDIVAPSNEAKGNEVKNNKVANKSEATSQPAPLDSSEQILRLHGSNTIGEKLAPALLKAFLESRGATDIVSSSEGRDQESTIYAQMPDEKKVAIELKAHGSSTAFKSLIKNDADIGMSSRPIKAKEVDRLLATVGDLRSSASEYVIALDGLAVIVNPLNTVETLSIEKISKIFSGEYTNWSQVGGGDSPINVYARDENSGTWDTFKSLVLKRFDQELTTVANRYESSSLLSDKVSIDPNGVGFIGLPYVRRAKAIAVSDSDSTLGIYPTTFTVSTEDYPLARRLFMYVPMNTSHEAIDFAEFATSETGQNVVEKIGLVSQNISEINPTVSPRNPGEYNKLIRDSRRLSFNVRFLHGASQLDNKARRDLERLIKYLKKNTGKELMLFGFTDSVGDKNNNYKLGLDRVNSVARLMEARGIYPRVIESFGEAIPIASNTSSSGRHKNRRVEVWVR